MTCTKCKKTKSDSDFSWRVKNVRKHKVCKECHSNYRQKHYRSKVTIYNQRVRTWQKLTGKDTTYYVARNHGYVGSVEDYTQHYVTQPLKCGICAKAGESLNKDHSHTTGQLRGWLCKKCNTQLAVIENEAWCNKAKLYLKVRNSIGRVPASKSGR